MIVSCESCKSRYKLDDSKVTGRGAKITCPKCKHVFVVLAPAPAPMELNRPAAQTGIATSDWEDDEPTRIGQEQPNLANMVTAKPQSALKIPSFKPATSPIAGPATHEVSLARPAAPALSKEEVTAKAAALDFRQVGVTAWKVKVKIGLVYDFSDLRTLRKYITDGRVTSADVISYDGKSWKPLGDIPDLDLFFIESYAEIEADFIAKGGGKKKDEPADMAIGNVADAIAAAVAAEEEGSKNERSTGPVYQDPFESLKQKQRERVNAKRAPAATDKKSSIGIWAAVIVVVLAGGAGAWWLGQKPPVVAVSPPAPSKTSKASKPAKSAQQVQEELLASAVPVDPPVPTVVSEAASLDCEKLIDGQCVKAVGPPGGRPSAAPVASAPVKAAGSPAAVTIAPAVSKTVTDDESVGDSAKRDGDWNTAATAYSKALASKGESGKLLYKYGEALSRVGDTVGAQGALQRASKQGETKAYKLLAEIAEKSGDSVGAKSLYESYLKSNPGDNEAQARYKAIAG